MEKEKTGIISVALKLFIICFVSTLILAFTNTLTKDVIEKYSKEEFDKSCKEIIPGCETESVDIEAYLPGAEAALIRGEDGTVIGIAIRQSIKGYSKGLDIMTCISNDGKTILGIDILNHSETPGYGAKADDITFTAQFENKVAPVATKENGGEIDGITGATKTTKAVLNSGVNAAAEAAKSYFAKEGE